MRANQQFRWAALAGILAAASLSAAQGLRLDLPSGRSLDDYGPTVDQALRRIGQRTYISARPTRDYLQQQGRDESLYATPMRVELWRNGEKLPFQPRGRAGDLTIEFETTGPRAFPVSYRQHLMDTFTQAAATMELLYGEPIRNTTVRVLNYDADLGDRDAVAGGAYVPNAPGGPEIRFPVYNSATAASVHFIHCMLLAFQADKPYAFDVYQEGLVRAATMAVARTPGTLPGGPTSGEVEAVLESSYDVSPFYMWWNQPSIGRAEFIAPNLINDPLPAGGSTGGIFLLRYQMAGTAWSRLTAEHPGFINEFNTRYFANPDSFQTEAALIQLGQTALNATAGIPNATVEGRTFADWARHQSIMDVNPSPGTKVQVQPFPLSPTGGSDDFGVFGIVVNAFRIESNGNETLLSGRTFPVYMRPDGSRFFTSAQDDVIDIAGAYGSVAPNFPAASNNHPYRTFVDVSFGSRMVRVSLPAGSYATGANPTPNNVYGTLRGIPLTGNLTVSITAARVATPIVLSVQNGAFGGNVVSDLWDLPQAMRVQVFRDGAAVFERNINKGQGELALDLAPLTAENTFTVSLTPGLSFYGMPALPERPNAAGLLGLAANQTLVAHWNPVKSDYDRYPNEGDMWFGRGYYVDTAAAVSQAIPARRYSDEPITVALEPGWNMVTNPLNQTLTLAQTQVTTGTEAFVGYNTARGDIVGLTAFGFQRDPADAHSGNLQAVSTLAANQAVWVRCDRPEGAVMLFSPSGSLQGRAPSDRLPRPDWEMQAEVRSIRGFRAVALFGQARKATNSFDALYDSEIPPATGGLQITVNDQYRDIKRTGSTVFRMKMTGLTPGLNYQFRIGRKLKPVSMVVLDRATGKRHYWRRGGSLFFRATSDTAEFDVMVGVSR